MGLQAVETNPLTGLKSGPEDGERRQAKILVGGRWLEIEWMPEENQTSLEVIIDDAAHGITEFTMGVWFGWTRSQYRGLLVLSQVAGVIDL